MGEGVEVVQNAGQDTDDSTEDNIKEWIEEHDRQI